MEASVFHSRIDIILASVEAASIAFNLDQVPVSVRDHVADFGVIECANLFEQFLGELFEDCLLGKVHFSQPLMKVVSPEEASFLLYRSDQPEPFLSWLPYKNTLDRANRLIANGIPFSRVPSRSADLTALKDLTTLRNFAAHGSESSERKFRELCAQRGYLGVTRAADFVLKEEQGSTQLDILLTRLKLLSSALTEPDENDVFENLGPEDPHLTGRVVAAGLYRCINCSEEQLLGERRSLAACLLCVARKCSSCGRSPGKSPNWLRVKSN